MAFFPHLHRAGFCAQFFWRRGKLWPFFPHLHRAGPAEALAFAHFSSGVGGNCGFLFSTSSPGRPRGSPGLCALFFWRRGKLWPFFPHLHRAGPAEALAFAHFSSGVLFFWRRGKLWPFFPHLHRAGPAEALAFAHFSSGVGGNCGLVFHIFTGQAPRKPWLLRIFLLA